MFNLDNSSKRVQFEYDRVHGLKEPVKIQDEPVKHIDETQIDIKAQNETIAIKNSYKGKTIDFGKRKKSSFILSDYSQKPKVIPTRYTWKKIDDKIVIKHRNFTL